MIENGTGLFTIGQLARGYDARLLVGEAWVVAVRRARVSG